MPVFLYYARVLANAACHGGSLGSSDIHRRRSINGKHLMLAQVMQARRDATAKEKRRETAFLSFLRNRPVND